jgi:mannosyltransferase
MNEKPTQGMGYVQRLLKTLPYTAPAPAYDDEKSGKGKKSSTLSFFRRRIRLKGNSSISIPLGFVLLFPGLVVILILILVIKHPSSPGRILVPAGAPPSIR